MKKYSLLLLAFFYFTATGLAQLPALGTRLPDFKLTGLLNYPKANAKLSHFTSRPTLLIFWNTHCTTGHDLLNDLKKKQQEAGFSFNILVLSSNEKSEVCEAFAGNPGLQGLAFPLMPGVVELKEYFPHRFEPLVIWLNKKREVQALTDQQPVTTQNLADFAAGKPLSLPVRKEYLDPKIFFSQTPMLMNDYDNTKHLLHYAFYLGGPREGIQTAISVPRYEKENGFIRSDVQSQPYTTLYKLAYQKHFNFHPSQLIVEGSNPENPTAAARFCVDLMVKDTSVQKAYRLLQRELDFHFNWKSSLEKREMEVLVLKKKGEPAFIPSRKGLKGHSAIKDDTLILDKISIEGLMYHLNHDSNYGLPLLDESGIDGRLTMTLPDFKNLQSLNQALNKYSFEIIRARRILDVIVLRNPE